MLIDQLPVLADPTGDDEIPIERGTNLYKIKLKNLPTCDVVIDPDLDKDSENPVQNKVLYRRIDAIEEVLNRIPPYMPVDKTAYMTKEVGRDAEGKLYTEPIAQAEVERAVNEWLATHTISGVVFTVHGKNLTLTPMD